MSYRRQRVAHELQERLAEILAQDVADPRLEGLTVTAVEVSPDLSLARVFYRSLGDPEAADAGLAAARAFLRRRMAEGLRLRRVPELVFRLDQSVDRGERIDQILREIRPGPDAPDEPAEGEEQ